MESFKDLALRILEKSQNFQKLKDNLFTESYKDDQTADSLKTGSCDVFCPDRNSTGEDDVNLSDENDGYSVKDISVLTDIPEWTLRRKIRNGELKASVAQDSKNPGKARFVVLREDLKAFMDKNNNTIADRRDKEHNYEFRKFYDRFTEEFDDVIDYGKLEIKRDELDMKAEAVDNLKVQRDIIEKQMMIKRLEIEKKLYQNVNFDGKKLSKCKQGSFMEKIRDFMSHEL